jgi:hypothetical protein
MGLDMTEHARTDMFRGWEDYVAKLERDLEPSARASVEFDPNFGFTERKKRFMVTWSVIDGVELTQADIEMERDHIDRLRREGFVDTVRWVATTHRRGGIVFRADTELEVRNLLEDLPLARKQQFHIDEMEVDAA